MRRGGRCSRRRGRPPGSACEGGFWPTGCRCVALGGGWGAGAAGFFRSCASPSASPPPSLPVASVRAGGLVGGRVGGGSRAVGSSSHFGSTRVPAQPSLHGRAGWPQPAAGPRPPSLFLTRGRVPLTWVWFGGGGGERRWRARRALWPSGDARRPAHGESGDGGRWGRPAAAGRVLAGARFRGTLSAGDGARDARVGAPLVAAPAPAASTRGACLGAAATRRERRRAARRPRGGRAVAAPPCARAAGRLPASVVLSAPSRGVPPGPTRQPRPTASSLASCIAGVAALLQGGAAGWDRRSRCRPRRRGAAASCAAATPVRPPAAAAHAGLLRATWHLFLALAPRRDTRFLAVLDSNLPIDRGAVCVPVIRPTAAPRQEEPSPLVRSRPQH